MRFSIIHRHFRKRLHKKKLKQFPHPDPRMRFLDNLILVLSVLFPITALPQITSIWTTQNAAGISILTWGLWFILSIPFVIYGFVHKAKPILIMHALWLIVYILVIYGAILYGGSLF